jgi:hypothetical protein
MLHASYGAMGNSSAFQAAMQVMPPPPPAPALTAWAWGCGSHAASWNGWTAAALAAVQSTAESWHALLRCDVCC